MNMDNKWVITLYSKFHPVGLPKRVLSFQGNADDVDKFAKERLFFYRDEYETYYIQTLKQWFTEKEGHLR
jgi:hypothetical protein